MADKSERIIILSAIVLVILLWLPTSGLMRTSVTIEDLEIEIVTSRDNYTLGENFTANVYLVNTLTRDIWMEPINSLSFYGTSENDSEPAQGAIDISWEKGTLIHLPAESKTKFVDLPFNAQYAGQFRIICLGAEKTVQIREPLKLGQGIGPLVDDWLDPEYALSRGFQGYINVSYVSEIPVRVIVSPDKVINLTIQLKLVPHVPEFTETEVLLDPKNAPNFRVDYVLLKKYVRYSPNGTILLRVDEPRTRAPAVPP